MNIPLGVVEMASERPGAINGLSAMTVPGPKLTQSWAGKQQTRHKPGFKRPMTRFLRQLVQFCKKTDKTTRPSWPSLPGQLIQMEI
jgi:hypothetical protein